MSERDYLILKFMWLLLERERQLMIGFGIDVPEVELPNPYAQGFWCSPGDGYD